MKITLRDKILFDAYRDGHESIKEARISLCADGKWNKDRYYHGMANGVIMAEGLLTDTAMGYLDIGDASNYKENQGVYNNRALKEVINSRYPNHFVIPRWSLITLSALAGMGIISIIVEGTKWI